MAETANVEILVEAVTEAAESALEDVGDEMNNMAADAAPANAASRKLGDALDKLSRKADDAGDEISQAGRRAAVTTGLFSSLTVSTDGLSFSMGTLSAAMTASLIPALLTLSTVLLPLVSVVGAVAAAGISLAAVFGGLTAVGVITHMQELRTAFAEARKEIMEIIEPLGEVFGPLLVDAVQALPDLVQSIVDSLGPLDQFANGLRTLGQEAMEAIPQITGVMFDLAETALPILISMIRDLRSVGPGVMSAVGEAVNRLSGPLVDLMGALAGMIGPLHQVGIVVGEIVFPALTRLFNLIEDAATFVMSLDESIRRLGLAGAITAPAIFGVASAIGSLTGPIGLVAAAIAAFASAYRADVMGIRDITDKVISGLTDFFESLYQKAQPALTEIQNLLRKYADVVQEAFSGSTADAIGDLVGNLQGLGEQFLTLVSDIASAVAPTFRAISKTLQQNSDQFRTLATMAVNAINFLVTGIRTVLLPAVRFVLMNFIIPLVNRLARQWSQNFGEILQETIETINAIVGIVKPILTFLGGLWKKYGDTIMAVTKFAFDIILGIIQTAMDAIYTYILVGLNLLQGDWGEAWNQINGFFEDALIGMVEFLNDWGIIEGIVGVLQSIYQGFVTVFTETIPEAIISGMAYIIGIAQAHMHELYNIFVDVWNAIAQIGANAIEGLVNDTINGLNDFLSTLDEVGDAISEIPGVNAPDIGSSLNTVSIDSAAVEKRKLTTDVQTLSNRAEENITTAVELSIEGTGQLAELIRDEASAEAKAQRRRDSRRVRRQGAGQ